MEDPDSSRHVVSRKNAGGRATEAGMDFQAAVATWIAAHILARHPIGVRFGLSATALPEVLRCETGEGLDDVHVTLEHGGWIDLQIKTQASVSQDAASALGKTIAQIVRLMRTAKATGHEIDVSKARAVLAVTSSAPRSLDALERGCRAFDLGGVWTITKAQRSEAERRALDLFETHARNAWVVETTDPFDEANLVLLARLFRIVRFSMKEGEDNWREAARTLGGSLYGSEAAGDAPLRDLKAIVRGLIASGAPADRMGLIRELRVRGHSDLRAPDFDADLARLSQSTDVELARLVGHTRLPIDGGVPILRRSDGPLDAAVLSGSVIVIGEPGAGKTGALVALAQARRAAGDTVVFLSVDRFPGVHIAADLQSELRLAHPLIDVLNAAPNATSKLLIIDALDAARGGPAEDVFAPLIEAVVSARLENWAVVASIRTFDLKNGRRFRDALPGPPPDPLFADMALNTVRHFLVPRLDEGDLADAGARSPELGSLIAAAPDELRDLISNVFNLSLAAQLLSDGASSESIRNVATQSDLIDAYEDRRLIETPLRRATAAAADLMIRRRRLTVRKVDVAHDRLDDVIRCGVMADVGDTVSFAHHVLFDHVVGRFILDCDNSPNLFEQIRGDSSVALMLAPGLRFALERLWRADGVGKSRVWRLVADIYTDTGVDPVLANVALRTATERVSCSTDVVGLTQLIGARAADEATGGLLSRIARFVGLAADAAGDLLPETSLAWATVAGAAAQTSERKLIDSSYFLLHTFFEKADLDDPGLMAEFGHAARALLALAWDSIPPIPFLAPNAIRFVGRSFASDPSSSRALLERALHDPHFSAHADKEAIWIAEQILPIVRSDSAFAVDIFKVLYSREISDTSTTYLGGKPSRILPLSSNRQQDYVHSRFQLGRQAGRMLEISAQAGTRAVVEAALGNSKREEVEPDQCKTVEIPGRPSFRLIGCEYSYDAWDAPDRRRGPQDDDVLSHYVAFLRVCSPESFAKSIEAAASNYSAPAVWARLLGIGAERVAELMDLLWPYARNPILLNHPDTGRNAIRFLAASYPVQAVGERIAFECEVLRPDLFDDEQAQDCWRDTLGRLLFVIDDGALATAAMRSLRKTLAAPDELVGALHLGSMAANWEPNTSVSRSLLTRRGVNVNDGVGALMLAQSEALFECYRQTSADSGAEALAKLWAETQSTVILFDSNSPDIHDDLEQPVWGHVSNAVERIAESKNYLPGQAGLPGLEILIKLLRRLWASRFPERIDDKGKRLTWGNWEVRVYAANAYVLLADRFGIDYPEIVAMLATILVDQAPQVRLQAAQRLQVLYRIAPDRMWSLAEKVACNESNGEVLAAFLQSFVWRLCWNDVERCEALIETILVRRLAKVSDSEGRDAIAVQLGGLAAQLWVGQSRPKAFGWVTAWATDPVAHHEFLNSFLYPVRADFFARYLAGGDLDPQNADRAQLVAMRILESCSTAAARSHAALTFDGVDGVKRDAAVAAYKAVEGVIGNLMNQLYFGSGAYASSAEKTVGLPSAEAMRSFLRDYRPMLDLLAASYEPSTHHHLAELYEYLIPGDPAAVFDALYSLLLGAGAREGYHHESLASAGVVKMITRYLADHRPIFEDDLRRTRLLEILRLFSEVGWPEALKLLYDLPELLR